MCGACLFQDDSVDLSWQLIVSSQMCTTTSEESALVVLITATKTKISCLYIRQVSPSGLRLESEETVREWGTLPALAEDLDSQHPHTGASQPSVARIQHSGLPGLWKTRGTYPCMKGAQVHKRKMEKRLYVLMCWIFVLVIDKTEPSMKLLFGIRLQPKAPLLNIF